LQPNLNIHQNIKYYYDKARKLEKEKIKNIKEESSLKTQYKKNSKIYKFAYN